MVNERINRTLLAGLLALQAIVQAAIVLLTRPVVFNRHLMDLTVYFRYSLDLLRGQVPYRDFAMEYPPLALLPFTLPRLVVFGQDLSFETYVRLFLLENVVFSTLVGLALAWTLAPWRPRRAVPALAIYTLFVAIVAPLLPWRYDLFPALLTALALLCVVRGRPSWAGLWLGLGVAAKLYPVVLLPIVGAYYLARADWRALIRVALGFAAALLLTLLPFAFVGPASLASFLRYHEMRGLQVESLPAGVIILAHVFGLVAAKLNFNYGALHLVSPLATPALRWLPLALLAIYGVVLVAALARFRHEQVASGAISNESLVAYLAAALLTFIVTNKVFSPQYLIWLLPFAPLLRRRQAALFAAICAITIVLFPFDYDDLLAMHLLPVLLLNLRNALVVALLAWLLLEFMPGPARVVLAARARMGRAASQAEGERL
jgi:hypothetical protein